MYNIANVILCYFFFNVVGENIKVSEILKYTDTHEYIIHRRSDSSIKIARTSLTLLRSTISVCFFGKYKSASRVKLWVSENRERVRKNKNASCMIYHRYTPISPQALRLSLSPAFFTACNHPFSRSPLFLAQQPLPQLLLPTFEVTSRPFTPSVIS